MDDELRILERRAAQDPNERAAYYTALIRAGETAKLHDILADRARWDLARLNMSLDRLSDMIRARQPNRWRSISAAVLSSVWSGCQHDSEPTIGPGTEHAYIHNPPEFEVKSLLTVKVVDDTPHNLDYPMKIFYFPLEDSMHYYLKEDSWWIRDLFGPDVRLGALFEYIFEQTFPGIIKFQYPPEPPSPYDYAIA